MNSVQVSMHKVSSDSNKVAEYNGIFIAKHSPTWTWICSSTHGINNPANKSSLKPFPTTIWHRTSSAFLPTLSQIFPISTGFRFPLTTNSCRLNFSLVCLHNLSRFPWSSASFKKTSVPWKKKHTGINDVILVMTVPP